MGDYNLFGLSWRSFEQLIQAVASRLIGPGIVVFGDGPDGGREATFEGNLPYPFDTDRWHGYCVLQAKFRQQSEGTQRDAAWALGELRSELKGFADAGTRRRRPDYYIFATNVKLTAVQDRGSKDQANALVRGFQEQIGLQDYRVWDYDQIRTYLDSCEDVRRSFAAFITPGDVLAAVMTRLERRRPDFERAMANYLQKELLADCFVNLEQAGHAAEAPVPLANVFVDLPAFDRRQEDPPDEPEGRDLPPGFVEAVLGEGAQKLDPASTQLPTSQRSGTGSQQGPQPGRFVLIGGPGQGKTTLGQLLCQVHRAAILKRRSEALYDIQIDQALNLGDLPAPLAMRFPIRIVLSHLADALASLTSDRPASLVSYIVQRIRLRTAMDVSVEDLREWLTAYPWLVVFDGLDEVPASSNRNDLLSVVKEFWVDAADCNADVLAVATTRPQGYSEEFSPDVYQHLWLAPLSTHRALRYAERLVHVRYGVNPDRKERVLSRLRKASAEQATARLMRSPLQVTIMATLVDQLGQPPDDRWRLFQQYYDVTYRREMERDIPAAETLRTYRHAVDVLHRDVGLRLQVDSEQVGRTDARLTRDSFSRLVMRHLAEEGHEGARLEEVGSRIIEAATQRLVFLVGLESDRIGFEIRSVQEFMAAECLMSGRDEEVSVRLREIALHAHWRNVFLFAAGRCFVDREYLRDAVYTICAQLNEDAGDHVTHVTLAGSQLALEILEDGTARRHPKYGTLFAGLALQLLDLPAGPWNRQLAGCYEPGLERVFAESISHRLRHTEWIERAGAWRTLLALIAKGVSWAAEMGNSNWPTPKVEQLAILESAPPDDHCSWLAARVVDVLPQLRPHEIARWFDRPTAPDLPQHLLPEWATAMMLLERMTEPWGNETLSCNLALSDSRAPSSFSFVLTASATIRGMRNTCERILALKRVPGIERTCVPWGVAVVFAEDTSRHALAWALRTIAEAYEQDPWSITRACRVLPWPIDECVNASDSADDLRKWASLAEQGEMADVDEWVAAEARWERDGVSVQEMLDAAYHGQPFDRRIADAGFPFLTCSASIGSELGADGVIQALRPTCKMLPAAKLRSRVSGWLYWMLALGSKGTCAVAQDMLDSGELESVIDDMNWRWFDFDWLARLAGGGEPAQQFIAFAEKLGMRSPRALRPATPEAPGHAEVLRALSRAVECNPRHLGILRLLADLAAAGYSIPIRPESLAKDRFEDDSSSMAAAVIRLTQSDLSLDEAIGIADQVARSVNQEQWAGLAVRSLRAVETGPTTNPAIDQFLVILMRERKACPESSFAALELLNASLAHRISRLGDPAVRNSLGLPDLEPR